MSLYDLDSNLLYMKSCFSKKRGFMYCLVQILRRNIYRVLGI